MHFGIPYRRILFCPTTLVIAKRYACILRSMSRGCTDHRESSSCASWGNDATRRNGQPGGTCSNTCADRRSVPGKYIFVVYTTVDSADSPLRCTRSLLVAKKRGTRHVLELSILVRPMRALVHLSLLTSARFLLATLQAALCP